MKTSIDTDDNTWNCERTCIDRLMGRYKTLKYIDIKLR